MWRRQLDHAVLRVQRPPTGPWRIVADLDYEKDHEITWSGLLAALRAIGDLAAGRQRRNVKSLSELFKGGFRGLGDKIVDCVSVCSSSSSEVSRENINQVVSLLLEAACGVKWSVAKRGPLGPASRNFSHSVDDDNEQVIKVQEEDKVEKPLFNSTATTASGGERLHGGCWPALSIKHPELLQVVIDIVPRLPNAVGTCDPLAFTLEQLSVLARACMYNREVMCTMGVVESLCRAEWVRAASSMGTVHSPLVCLGDIVFVLSKHRISPVQLNAVLRVIGTYGDPSDNAAAVVKTLLSSLRQAGEATAAYRTSEPAASRAVSPPPRFLDFRDARATLTTRGPPRPRRGGHGRLAPEMRRDAAHNTVTRLSSSSYVVCIKFRIESLHPWVEVPIKDGAAASASAVVLEGCESGLFSLHAPIQTHDIESPLLYPRLSLTFVKGDSVKKRLLKISVSYVMEDDSVQPPRMSLRHGHHVFPFAFSRGKWYTICVSQRAPKSTLMKFISRSPESTLSLFVDGSDRTGPHHGTIPYPVDLATARDGTEPKLVLCLGACGCANLLSFRGQVAFAVAYRDVTLDTETAIQCASVSTTEPALAKKLCFALDMFHSLSSVQTADLDTRHHDAVQERTRSIRTCAFFSRRHSRLCNIRSVGDCVESLCSPVGLLPLLLFAERRFGCTFGVLAEEPLRSSPALFDDAIGLMDTILNARPAWSEFDFALLHALLTATGICGRSSRSLTRVVGMLERELTDDFAESWSRISPFLLDWRWFASTDATTQGQILSRILTIATASPEPSLSTVLQAVMRCLFAYYPSEWRGNLLQATRSEWNILSERLRAIILSSIPRFFLRPGLASRTLDSLLETFCRFLIDSEDATIICALLDMFSSLISHLQASARDGVAEIDAAKSSGRLSKLSGMLRHSTGPKELSLLPGSPAAVPSTPTEERFLKKVVRFRRETLSLYSCFAILLRKSSANVRTYAFRSVCMFADKHLDLLELKMVPRPEPDVLDVLNACLWGNFLTGAPVNVFPPSDSNLKFVRNVIWAACEGSFLAAGLQDSAGEGVAFFQHVRPTIRGSFFELLCLMTALAKAHQMSSKTPRWRTAHGHILQIVTTLARIHAAEMKATCFCKHISCGSLFELLHALLDLDVLLPQRQLARAAECQAKSTDVKGTWAEQLWQKYLMQKVKEAELLMAPAYTNLKLLELIPAVITHNINFDDRTFVEEFFCRMQVQVEELGANSTKLAPLYLQILGSIISCLTMEVSSCRAQVTNTSIPQELNVRLVRAARMATEYGMTLLLVLPRDESLEIHWPLLAACFRMLSAATQLYPTSEKLRHVRLALLVVAVRHESTTSFAGASLVESYDDITSQCLNANGFILRFENVVLDVLDTVCSCILTLAPDGVPPPTFERRVLLVWAISALCTILVEAKDDLFDDEACPLDSRSLGSLFALKNWFDDAAALMPTDPLPDDGGIATSQMDLIPKLRRYFNDKDPLRPHSAIVPALIQSRSPQTITKLESEFSLARDRIVAAHQNAINLEFARLRSFERRCHEILDAFGSGLIMAGIAVEMFGKNDKDSTIWRLDPLENPHRMRLRLRNTRHDAFGHADTNVAVLERRATQYSALLEKYEEGHSNVDQAAVVSQANQPESAHLDTETAVQLVTPWHSLTGSIVLADGELRFTTVEQMHYNDVFSNAVALHDVRTKTWALSSIREVHSRSFMLRDSALEFFCADHTNFFIGFRSFRARKEFFAELKKLQRKGLMPLLTSTKLHGLNKSAILKKEQLVKRWQQREMSNFDYIMALNTISGRTYNDLSQYPVFPWVLADYSSSTLDLSDATKFRDLSKPIGALNARRANAAREKFESWVDTGATDEDSIKAFHWGSHYSTEATVLYYLIRTEPFTYLHTELQSGRFDRPDRLFSSIAGTWNSCLRDEASVQELIPEFFYFPEFLTCAEHLKLAQGTVFGTKQDGKLVGDVELPPWAHGSPMEFVRLHRLALESDHVSAHLHEWVDLVFGFKSRGRDAVQAVNVFYYLTYSESIPDLDSMPAAAQAAIQDQIRHFGQTPAQLFFEPHPTRQTDNQSTTILSTDAEYQAADLFEAEAIQITRTQTDGSATPLVFVASPSLANIGVLAQLRQRGAYTVITVDGERLLATHRWLPRSQNADTSAENIGEIVGATRKFTFEMDHALLSKNRDQLSFAPSLDGRVPELQLRSECFVLTKDGRVLITGGFADNSIHASNVQNTKQVAHFIGHSDVVVALALDGPVLASASRDATVRLWHLGSTSEAEPHVSPSSWFALEYGYCLRGHTSCVSAVAVRSTLDTCVSMSSLEDGTKTILVHALAGGAFIRRIASSNVPISLHPTKETFLGSDLLSVSLSTGLIAVFSLKACMLQVFTVNGQLCSEAYMSEAITCMANIHELQTPRAAGGRLEAIHSSHAHEEYLVMGGVNGRIEVRGPLPLLSLVHRFSVHSAVNSITTQTRTQTTRGDDGSPVARTTSQFLLVALANGKLLIITPRDSVRASAKKRSKKKSSQHSPKRTHASPTPVALPLSARNSLGEGASSSENENIPEMPSDAVLRATSYKFAEHKHLFVIRLASLPNRELLLHELDSVAAHFRFSSLQKSKLSSFSKKYYSDFRVGEGGEYQVQVTVRLDASCVVELCGELTSAALLGWEDELTADSDSNSSYTQSNITSSSRSRFSAIFAGAAASATARASGIRSRAAPRFANLRTKISKGGQAEDARLPGIDGDESSLSTTVRASSSQAQAEEARNVKRLLCELGSAFAQKCLDMDWINES